MSDTPRTDEEMWTTDYHHELCNVVNTEFARQLERELNASLENQVKSMEKLVEQQDFTLKAAALLSKAVSQRDRAIEIADEMEQSIDTMFYAGGRVKLPIFKKFAVLKAQIEETA
jgi:hypothetical protein